MTTGISKSERTGDGVFPVLTLFLLSSPEGINNTAATAPIIITRNIPAAASKTVGIGLASAGLTLSKLGSGWTVEGVETFGVCAFADCGFSPAIST